MAPPCPNSSQKRRPFPSDQQYLASISTSSSTSDLQPLSAYSPRRLYAASFPDRPFSSESDSVTTTGPASRHRKSVKEMAGFSTTSDEFNDLPIQVQKKYFSTLERLRFAQNSQTSTINDLSVPRTQKALGARRRTPVSRHSRKISRQSSMSSTELSWFMTLPEKIREKQFTREEQVVLASRLRESVLLDATDAAIYKVSRRAGRHSLPMDDPVPDPVPDPEPFLDQPSMDQTRMAGSILDSFRWMDEEAELDLSLNLDDYHANIDGVVLPDSGSKRRPSFRRHMSISKIPFGRNSISSLQPRSPILASGAASHFDSKTRTVSLSTPKHVSNDSIVSIDPNATHYQDPEARLKLRVYLASPQKFDEAIEFGFPSMDGVTDGADKENHVSNYASRDGTLRHSLAVEKNKETFLNDDTASLFSDDVSMADTDSPIPPMDFRATSCTSKRSGDSSHSETAKPIIVKPHESCALEMAGNREMTLRMTLTRPDLRATKSSLNGWQTNKSLIHDDFLVCGGYLDGSREGRGPIGGADGWIEPVSKDGGVVKRLWNRVRSQRKEG